MIEATFFDEAEEIFNLFMSKIETLDGTDNTYYAKFELNLDWLRRAQGIYDTAYELAKSAYEKFLSINP